MRKINFTISCLLTVIILFNASGCKQGKPVGHATQTPVPQPITPVQQTRPEASIDEIQAMARSLNAFALDLHSQLRAKSGNLAYSPYSIYAALAMAQAGAAGETESRMAQALHFSLPRDRAHAAFSRLDARIVGESRAGVQIHTANALWIHRDFKMFPQYINMLFSHYGAAPRTIDVSRPRAAAAAINAWVAEQTRNAIPSLVNPESISSDLCLVLANAFYFKGLWQNFFEVAATRIMPFWVDRANGVPAQTMFQKGEFRYSETLELQMLELPYRDSRIAMVILLPRQLQGLAGLEAKLGRVLEPNIARLQSREVQVYLPRFYLNWGEDLSPALKALGMRVAFERMLADFSRIADNRDLFISQVIHKSIVKVQEEGTEAAAATAVLIEQLDELSIPAKPKVFRADHPFLFLIREYHTGAWLFVGRVNDPGKEDR